MSKFIKKGSDVLLVKINSNELSTLLKCNVPCELQFRDADGNYHTIIELGERGHNGVQNTIDVVIDGESSVISYSKLIPIINGYDGLILEVLFTESIFRDKEPLLVLLNEIKSDLRSICTYIDYYDDKFLLMNNPFQNGAPNKIYYWTESNSMLAFTKNGPVIINDKFTDIEEFLCN